MATAHYVTKTGSKEKAVPHYNYIMRLGKYSRRLQTEKIEYSSHGNMPKWAADDPIEFWKAAAEHERANGSAYREYEISLPRELSKEQRISLIEDYILRQFGQRHVYSYAIHNKKASDGGEQPHVHLMICERELDGIERGREQFFKRFNRNSPNKGGAKKVNTGMKPSEGAKLLKEQRQLWEEVHNAWVAACGYPEAAIDLRSLKEQGIDRIPEPHYGPVRMEILRRGGEIDPFVTDYEEEDPEIEANILNKAEDKIASIVSDNPLNVQEQPGYPNDKKELHDYEQLLMDEIEREILPAWSRENKDLIFAGKIIAKAQIKRWRKASISFDGFLDSAAYLPGRIKEFLNSLTRPIPHEAKEIWKAYDDWLKKQTESGVELSYYETREIAIKWKKVEQKLNNTQSLIDSLHREIGELEAKHKTKVRRYRIESAIYARVKALGRRYGIKDHQVLAGIEISFQNKIFSKKKGIMNLDKIEDAVLKEMNEMEEWIAQNYGREGIDGLERRYGSRVTPEVLQQHSKRREARDKHFGQQENDPYIKKRKEQLRRQEQKIESDYKEYKHLKEILERNLERFYDHDYEEDQLPKKDWAERMMKDFAFFEPNESEKYDSHRSPYADNGYF